MASAKVMPVTQRVSAAVPVTWVIGHCRSPVPVEAPWHCIGAPASLVVLFMKSELLMVNAVPPAMAAAKKPLPPSEWLSEKVTLVSVPPLPKIDIAPPRPMVAWLPAKVSLVNVEHGVVGLDGAGALGAMLAWNVDAVITRSLWWK